MCVCDNTLDTAQEALVASLYELVLKHWPVTRKRSKSQLLSDPYAVVGEAEEATVAEVEAEPRVEVEESVEVPNAVLEASPVPSKAPNDPYFEAEQKCPTDDIDLGAIRVDMEEQLKTKEVEVEAEVEAVTVPEPSEPPSAAPLTPPRNVKDKRRQEELQARIAEVKRLVSMYGLCIKSR